MTQDNLSPDPASDPSKVPNSPAEEKSAKSQPARARKKRWVRRIVTVLGVLILLLLILLLLAPTLLSTGAARAFVLGKVNDNINGKVTVGDWSIGWRGGISADDVKVFDANQKQILQMPRFRSQISLLGLIRGQIHLGDTSVEGLDFFAEQYADGSSNFSKLAKKSDAHPAPAESSHEAKPSTVESSRLPSIDGALHLVDCRGTLQDDASNKTIQFTTIAGDVKIPSINSPIENTLKLVAKVDGQELLALSVDGKLQVAADNVQLPPGKMVGSELITINARDLKLVQSMIDAFASVAPVAVKTSGTTDKPIEPSTKLASGSIGGPIQLTGDGNSLSIAPNLSGQNVALSKGSVIDSIGNVVVDGKCAIVPGNSASEISNVIFSNFRVLGVGSGVTLNGTLEDISHSRNFKNVTADLTYNLGMIFDFIRPLLAKDSQDSMKQIKIAGNFTKQFVINGSYPADKPMNEAIVPLQSSGEFTIDLFDSSGAVIKTFTLPYVLSNGKLRVAYANKPAGQDLPAPADANGGKFNIAAATLDLSKVHPTLTIPDGTKMLDGVGINPLFAQTYLSGWLHSPLFAGTDKASAQLFVTMQHCDRLPADTLVEENVPENAGVADVELRLTGLELGSKFINQLNSAMALVNRGKVASNGLQLTIPKWTVHIEHGVVTQDMQLMVGRNPPMDLAGTVSMKTHALAMTLTIPISKEQGIKIPVTGTADDPKLDTGGVLKQNLQNIPGVPKELKGILGDKKDNSTTQPSNSGKGADGVGDLLNNVFNKKDDKKKDGTTPEGNGN